MRHIRETSFLKLKSLSNVTLTLRTVSDGAMLRLRVFIGKKRVRLLRCLDVPIMMNSVLLALSLRLLFVIQPEISLRQSPSCLWERSVSAVDKEISGVVYRVNSSGSRTEPWGTPQNKGTTYLLLIETYLLRMS